MILFCRLNKGEVMVRKKIAMDGNEAAAYVAYRASEVIAIYPITPSSNMGEHSDLWSVNGVKNIWGSVPKVVEMQSEGGAAAACHGSLQTGSMTTTFTASQGLLLMIPNMFKIAGELTSTVFHVSARSLAYHALSIFGDHSDVMAARTTGWAMTFSNSVQEVMDMALISQAATMKAGIPFLHAFDGFRTSHEVMKVELLDDADIRAMVDDDLVEVHRARALSPDRPILRGTAQNPDVYFQSREGCNPYYIKTPGIVQEMMDKFAGIVGRQYKLFDYVGAPDAERVIIMMGSGCSTTEETINHLVGQGEKVGLIKIRLYRPFSVEHFLGALPATTKVIAALDRTKEPGATGEPLYQDVVTAVAEGMSQGTTPFKEFPKIIGGRYGLSSKEYTPAMVKGIFDEMAKAESKNHFTVGIVDDVANTSIDYDPSFDIEADDVTRAVFWGLGADGTVGANKNSIKIIAEGTDFGAQGYFVYDSKKSGARTVSHLRFGPRDITRADLITKANFVAVHQYVFLDIYDTLEMAADGATFLLNSPYGPDEVWDKLPPRVQRQIVDKKLNFYVIDAGTVAEKVKMGTRINTIMQTCFFAISGVLEQETAIQKIKESIKKTYGRRGDAIVQMNYDAVDASLANLHQVKVPDATDSGLKMKPIVPDEAPDFVRNVIGPIMAGAGDSLPVSALPADGTFPTATTKWEKRNIAREIPVWESDLCIQCGKCSLVCPHAVIRSKVYDESALEGAPATFKSTKAKFKELGEKKYTLQIAAEDCTGCALCISACPVKDKAQPGRKAINMAPQLPLRDTERENWNFFLGLPQITREGEENGDKLKFRLPKDIQLLEPLFEFSGACGGCGETPYVKLLSQLFGDRTLIANATGCSSIYGGNLPTTPYAVNKYGRGPSWSNSLFEDNAEFGMGMRLAADQQNKQALELVAKLKDEIGGELANAILEADQSTEPAVAAQRERVAQLKKALENKENALCKNLSVIADALVKKDVWILGGDGWAYDIGYGGLDHVLASGENVNVLVMDTEVYSNTGGQASKATSIGAVAKFAMGGKNIAKKDLGLIAMAYGYVYVAQIAMGANDSQTIKAFLEAEAYNGPSLIIAYSHCIAHGIDMAKGLEQQALAVKSGHWPLYRYNPVLKAEGKNPFQLDSKPPAIPLKDYVYNENRYKMLVKSNPDGAAELLKSADVALQERWKVYQMMANAE